MSVYRFISTAYDLLEVIWFSEKGKNPRTVIQSLIPDKKYRILDMCCGTFTNGFSIAQKNINNKVLGIDLSKEMLLEAKRKVAKASMKNVYLRYADATDTKLPAESFDYVILGLVLHECSPQLRADLLKEAYRVLKPDGRLIILEWENPQGICQKIKYAPLYLLETLGCKSFREFFACDKKKYFKSYGFLTEKEIHCNYSIVMELKKEEKAF